MINQSYHSICTPELLQGAIENNEYHGFREDYHVLWCLLKKYNPKSVFECGTNMGTGTNIICHALPNAKVYSLDLPTELAHVSLQHPISEGKGDNVGIRCKKPFTQLRGDSLTHPFAAVDAFFIDGEHDYLHPYVESKRAFSLRPKLIAHVWPILLTLTPLFAFIEDSTGLTVPLFISFFTLNTIEWLTGIRASKAEGKPISSLKLHRFLGKVMIYIVMLATIRQYVMHAKGDIGSETAAIVWLWVYWGIFNYISLILIKSIFENLHRMGWKEAGKIYGILDNKLTRWFAYIVAPPDKEKTER